MSSAPVPVDVLAELRAELGDLRVELSALRVELSALRVELVEARGTPSSTSPARLLSRGDLRELGLERRAVDAVFRELPVVVLPGYSRPLIREADFVELVDRSAYDGARVRP